MIIRNLKNIEFIYIFVAEKCGVINMIFKYKIILHKDICGGVECQYKIMKKNNVKNRVHVFYTDDGENQVAWHCDVLATANIVLQQFYFIGNHLQCSKLYSLQ